MGAHKLQDPQVMWALIHITCWLALLFLLGTPTEEDLNKEDDNDPFY